MPGYLLPTAGINHRILLLTISNFSKMKKLFAIAIIAASLAACNNSADSSKTTDSTTVTPDTTTMAPDTMNKMAPDTMSKMAPDTSAKK
jgi:hypothetical protein